MANQGILQAQINIKNKIDLNNAFSSDTIQNPLLKSIEGNLNLKDKNSLVHFNGGNNAVEHIDAIVYEDSDELDITNALNNNASVKYLKIDANVDPNNTSKFANNSSLEKLDSMLPIEAGISAFENTNLKQIPNASFNNPDQSSVLTNDSNLAPTTIDFSDKDNMTRLGVYGEESDEISNLQFVKVSTEAPFDHQITPQIDVSYTGLDKNALINLFNTLPYNVGYTVVGTPAIADGVVSGFSNSDYLRTSQTIPQNSYVEAILKIKLTDYSQLNRAPIITFAQGNGSIEITSSRKLFVLGYTSTGSYKQGEGTSSLSVNNWIYIKFIYNAEGLTVLLSNDGESFQEEVFLSDVVVKNLYSASFGSNNGTGNYLKGSIDLNETWIKIYSNISTGPVGYTVVGSPTIVYGVASGFSSSNYIGFDSDLNILSSFDNWEIVCKFKHKTVSSNTGFLGNTGSNLSYIGISSDNSLKMLFFNDSGIIANLIGNTTLTENISYYAKFTYSSLYGYKMYLSNDNIQYTLEGESNNTQKFKQQGVWRLGYVASTSGFNGSIDLNNTYIKVNGKLWFGHESKQVTWFNGTNAVNQRQLSSDLKAIGTLTIVNGFVSGFSANDYVQVSAKYPNNDIKTLSFHAKFTTPSSFASSAGAVIGYSTNNGSNRAGVGISANGAGFRWIIGKVDTTDYILTIDNLAAQANSTYIANGYIDGNTAHFSITDSSNNTYTATMQIPDTIQITTNYNFLVGASPSSTSVGQIFTGGSIDLNNTYIKVNGSVWMHGTDLMTKKCSIIGCTGTSSLTVEDKAIVTNKGWTLLTVAS